MMAAMAVTAMSLGELLGATPAAISQTIITDLVSDSRQVQPGAAFVAIKGGQAHGLEYAVEAVERGATVVLYDPGSKEIDSVDARKISSKAITVAVPNLDGRLGELAMRFYSCAESGPRLAGITGTNGKSTVAYLAAQAQTLRGYPSAYIGTVGSGIPPELKPQKLTTPDCLSLHRTLATLEVDYAAVEVSSHALAQDRIAGLKFDTAVFTNLTRDHLDYHGDFASYQKAKARLFQTKGLQKAIIFSDDPFADSLAHKLDDLIERVDVSFKNTAHLSGKILDSGLQGLTVEVSSSLVSKKDGSASKGKITSPLIGDFNAENLVLALGVLLSWEAPFHEACEALSQCVPPPGRMEVLVGSNGRPTVVIDYAHTPVGLERVLTNLNALTDANLWCVFGCGGERDVGKRALMGVSAARFASHIVLTDDNPRSENPSKIVADIYAAVTEHPDVRIEHDRARAIKEAVLGAGPDDIVLVAGKGHETWQYLAGERREFKDHAVIEEVLGGKA